jgi:hypothetical protein
MAEQTESTRQQRAMLAIQDAAKLAVFARCYRDDAVAEFARAWEWWEAERPTAEDNER